MIRKLHVLLLLFFLIGCKEKEENPTSIIEETNTVALQEAVHPIPENILNSLSDSIRLYYNKANNSTIWYAKENREALIAEIKNSFKEGLNPDDYNLKKIEVAEAARKQLSDKEIIALDTLLTASYQLLATHLFSGKLSPNEVYNDWDLTKKQIFLSDTLRNAIQQKKITESFHQLKPKHPVYAAIKKSLLLLDQFPEYNFEKLFISEKIEVNDTLDEVISIKKRLKYWKDYTRNDSIVTPVYDSITYLAIKKFQKRHGLKPDGVIGNGTIKALNYTKEERKQQIIANLERWKWFPETFGQEYLLVNLPDYTLNYIINNDTISKNTVVVGKKSRRTPVLTSRLSNLVFNPTWTVPPTIIKEDLTPAATNNRNYFSRNNMTIYNSAGEKVTAEDWNPELSRTYRYVQKSSNSNALGVVKFNFPNKRLVYLHDTNHRNYFSRENKALSSGCVRVENPLALSEKILAHENEELWNKTEIDSIIKRKSTKSVRINHDINVFLLYWTNWSENNQLVFRDDIYGLDEKLYKALRN